MPRLLYKNLVWRLLEGGNPSFSSGRGPASTVRLCSSDRCAARLRPLFWDCQIHLQQLIIYEDFIRERNPVTTELSKAVLEEACRTTGFHIMVRAGAKKAVTYSSNILFCSGVVFLIFKGISFFF
jgi:hypothetical protein